MNSQATPSTPARSIFARWHFDPAVTNQTLIWRLRPDAAPVSVKHFIQLVQRGFYAHRGCIYRYERAFVLQGGLCGEPSAKQRARFAGLDRKRQSMPPAARLAQLQRFYAEINASWSDPSHPHGTPLRSGIQPALITDDETDADIKWAPLEYQLPNRKYFVALARTSDPNSGGTEFFINLADNSGGLGRKRNGGYAVFAELWNFDGGSLALTAGEDVGAVDTPTIGSTTPPPATLDASHPPTLHAKQEGREGHDAQLPIELNRMGEVAPLVGEDPIPIRGGTRGAGFEGELALKAIKRLPVYDSAVGKHPAAGAAKPKRHGLMMLYEPVYVRSVELFTA
jgi:cyclophilin family peptidyl-prolyl cis-trans isomerase